MNRKTNLYLVTGGCGFIGSHIVDKLIADGNKVVVVDDLSTGNMSNLNNKSYFHQGDSSDKVFMSSIFKKYAIDYVIHQASKINTNALHEDPEHDVRCSIGSILILANLCVQYHVKKIIFASSVAVYGRPKDLPASECSVMEPIYSYGIAKLCAEQYLKYYQENYDLNYTILRYCNVFGPRQSIYGEVGVIAIFAEKIINGEPLIIFGNGNHVRDYIYISDVVDFTLHCIKIIQSSIFNVGRGIPVTVNYLYEIFVKNNRTSFEPKRMPERYGEIGKFYADISQSKATGWESKISIEKGIDLTMEYLEEKRLR
jgi:UDP-glucose 4-epimerase